MGTDFTPCRHWRASSAEDGVVTLTLDCAASSTNTLSAAVLDELDQLLGEVEAHPPRALVFRSGKTNGFVAGADVREFTAIETADAALRLIERGQALFNRIAQLPLPTVALIDGFCLGGGLELALACRYRIASDGAGSRFGFPEILLGIHPGFGGTVRSIALLGPLTALELMLTGRTLAARQAKQVGLLDLLVPARQLEHALAALLAAPPPRRPLPLRERLAAWSLLRPLVARILRRQVAAKADPRHYPAPTALLRLWQAFGRDASANYAAEAASVAALITGATAQNLVRVFLLQETLKALGKNAAALPRNVHVVGAGVMGGDIAIWCALQGLEVTIEDLDLQRLGQVVKRGQLLFSRILKEPRAVREALDRLIPDPAGHGAARADLVIEAIFEDVAAKRALFQQLETRMRPAALLASNTSSIPLEELADALQRPERLVGLHFFNPVEKMQLVEVVATPTSAPEALEQAAALVLAIKRLPLPVRSVPGFLVNRILLPYLLEAMTLVEEGVEPAVIDRAATDFGMPLGPLRLADAVGLDICLSVGTIFSRHYGTAVPPRLAELVAAGRLGRKSGQGFYDYRHKERQTSVGTVPAEIGERLILRLLNEAVACRRAGVVAEGDLLDAGMIFGSGFAPFRGGPLHYVAAVGAPVLHERLVALAQRHGARFTPDPGWRDLLAKEASP